jgi:hypothetical protein
MKNVIFWDVMPRSSCQNRRFEGKYRLHYQGENLRTKKSVSGN